MPVEKVKRTINFYYLSFNKHRDLSLRTGETLTNVLFETILSLSKTRAKIRYQNFGEKAIFIQDVSFVNEGKQITAKLRCIRKDILPEIMNVETDEARGIEAKEEEGLLETTHIVIDVSTRHVKLAIEYNQFGAKITDFMAYLSNIGTIKGIVSSVGMIPVVKDELKSLKERIQRCSEFTVKVHKDNVEKIKTLDKKVYSAIKASIDHFKSEYATLILKFDYKERKETNAVNNSIFNLINKLIKNKENVELFNNLTVKAEDSQKNDKLEEFDLLIDKVKSELWVQKREKYRTLISTDIIGQMQNEIHKRRI